MPLANDLIETYDTVFGHEPEGMEKIAPIAHHYFSIHQVIDITIDQKGEFADAEVNSKLAGKTLLAVTEESASRTSAAAVTPHALNDNLMFMTSRHGVDGKPDNQSYKAFMAQLEGWAESEDAPSGVRAVYQYLLHHDPIDDMLASNKLPEGKDGTIDFTKYMKYVVRWKVIGRTDDAIEETWNDPEIVRSWTRYYLNYRAQNSSRDLDAMTGTYCNVEMVHPKPISAYGNSKLISIATKEDSTLHFKGERFNQSGQILQIGYLSSQKMHNAFSWLIDTQAIAISKNSLSVDKTKDKPRFIVCWEPHFEPKRQEGIALLEDIMACCIRDGGSQYQSKRDAFRKKLYGQQSGQVLQHKVSVLMIDRSGDGRLSPVLYRSFTVEDFFNRLDRWQENCRWYSYDPQKRETVLKNPSLFALAQSAFGVERENDKGKPCLDVNDSVFKDTVNVLLRSVLDGKRLPESFVRQITSQASSPERFKGVKGSEWVNWKRILWVACAAIHQWKLSKNEEKGESDLKLDRESTDRSYLFGRLLAICDRIENQALNRKANGSVEGKTDHRDTNAMRLWSAYAAHPFTCCKNLRNCIAPYLSSLPYGSRKFYEDEMQSIFVKLDMHDPRINHPLDPEYLIGFYQERAALFSGQDK